MSETRRVVVTGMGAVTPLGNNAADTWGGLKNGRNGIAPITLFDTEKYKAKMNLTYQINLNINHLKK